MMQKSRGFSLVELLIVMLVLSIVAGATMGLLVSYMKQSEQTNELTTARQRAEMVFAILDTEVLHAGLGMPDDDARFQAVFSGLDTISSWSGPVSVVSGDILQIVYAVPMGIGVANEYDLSSGVDHDITVTGDISTDLVSTQTTKTKGWVILPSLLCPVKVKDINGTTLTIETPEAGELSFFDELHYLRALRSMVSNGTFYTEDVTNQSAQPRVEGIMDVRFQWDQSSHVLGIWVLARGDTRHSGLISPQTLPDWPFGNLPDETRHYRVTVLHNDWRVRN